MIIQTDIFYVFVYIKFEIAEFSVKEEEFSKIYSFLNCLRWACLASSFHAKIQQYCGPNLT